MRWLILISDGCVHACPGIPKKIFRDKFKNFQVYLLSLKVLKIASKKWVLNALHTSIVNQHIAWFFLSTISLKVIDHVILCTKIDIQEKKKLSLKYLLDWVWLGKPRYDIFCENSLDEPLDYQMSSVSLKIAFQRIRICPDCFIQ